MYAPYIKELSRDVKDGKYGKVFSGSFRAPMDYESVYSGFMFYAEHLVTMACEVFGYDPISVYAKRRDNILTATLRYESRDVTLEYVDKNYTYYASVSAEGGVFGKTFDLGDAFLSEFMAFCDVLYGNAPSLTVERLTAPVFILNAIKRSVESGKEECVRALREA